MKILTETGVRRLVKRVCEDNGRPVPEIFFVDHHISHTHEDGITICSPAWVHEHRAGTGMAYRLLVLHELTHWFTPGEGHTARFYGNLFALCADYGVRVSFAYEDEVQYRPRAARAGLELLVA